MIAMIKLGDICEKASSNIAQKDLDGHQGKYAIYGANGLIKYVDFYQQDKPYIAIVKDGAGIGRIMKLPAETSVIGTLQYIMPNSDIDIDYLAYAMEHMNLAKYSTGSTIPHIYFKDYKNEILPLPALSEQKKIGGILDKIDKNIMKNRQQLDKLNELVKSRFIEMFGDSERNPHDFPIAPWEEVFITTTGKLDSNAMVEGGQYPFFTCAKEHFWIDNYAFDCEALLLAGNNAAGVYDVKYYNGKFNAYQRTYVLTLVNKQCEYMLFKRQLEDKLSYLQNQSKGTNTRYLTLGILKELRFIIPPIELQKKFADFVEQTDKSKLAIQKSLEKLEILKKSLMQEYFG